MCAPPAINWKHMEASLGEILAITSSSIFQFPWKSELQFYEALISTSSFFPEAEIPEIHLTILKILSPQNTFWWFQNCSFWFCVLNENKISEIIALIKFTALHGGFLLLLRSSSLPIIDFERLLKEKREKNQKREKEFIVIFVREKSKHWVTVFARKTAATQRMFFGTID